MKCQWSSLLGILPGWMQDDVDRHGRETLQELRLRVGRQPELVKKDGSIWLTREASSQDIRFCINAASRYSPWTAGTVRDGYLTAAGGHRIGLCGECVYENGEVKNIHTVSSVCIRVARDFDGISGQLYKRDSSILIIGSPGSGKTTFLRDLIRNISQYRTGAVAVLDERRELFPMVEGRPCFPAGRRTDVLSGCRKKDGLERVLRTMGPSVIALDELVSQEECEALLYACWCGTRLIATAHATCFEELCFRSLFQPILQSGVFSTLVTIHPDKTWQEELLKR